MSTAEAMRDIIAPLLPDWILQFGRWVDAPDKTRRYVVIRPAGGQAAELLRRPQFTVAAIGGANEASGIAAAAAEQIVAAMRAASGSLPHFDAGEPVFMATEDGRPVFELAVSTITD
jgi:hypothetical protein